MVCLSMGYHGERAIGNLELVERSSKDATLLFNCNTCSFIKNNEYFGPYLEGHTIAGYQLNPHLNYNTVAGIVTKLGVFVQQDWASTKFFAQVSPTFTLQYQSGVNTFLIGTLDGIDQHRLLSPLSASERMLTEMPETGFRIHHLSKTTFADLWLHWLTLLDKKKGIPEELIAGFSLEQVLVQIDNFTMQLPFQLLLYHQGGQGILIKDYSLLMGAIGNRIKFHIGANSIFRELSLALYYVMNQYIKKPHIPVKRGHGLYGEVICNTAWLIFKISYWNAYSFSSGKIGHPIYQTNYCRETKAQPKDLYRHLIFLHLIGTYHIANGLTLVLHIDPYYDLKHRLFEHEAGLYLNYNIAFKLLELENN